MISVLFVCHGNICRSPMAEFVLRDLVRQRQLTDRFTVASCATSREELGQPIHPGTVQKLRAVGIPCAGKRATQLTAADYARYDHILCMDYHNLQNTLRILGGDPQHKVRLLLSCAGRPDEVADPWYTDNFDATYRDVLEGCQALLDALK